MKKQHDVNILSHHLVLSNSSHLNVHRKAKNNEVGRQTCFLKRYTTIGKLCMFINDSIISESFTCCRKSSILIDILSIKTKELDHIIDRSNVYGLSFEANTII